MADLRNPKRPKAETKAELQALLKELGLLNADGTGLRPADPTNPRRGLIEAEGIRLDEIGNALGFPPSAPSTAPAPRGADELASTHGIQPDQVRALETMHARDPEGTAAWLKSMDGSPGLADRLLAQFGPDAAQHFKPVRDGVVDVHGDLDIDASKLASLSDADLAKLVDVCRNRGPTKEDYEYFESTSTKNGKPGARIRFKSRVTSRANEVAAKVLESVGIHPDDPRAALFKDMSDGDAMRMWDLFNERGYGDANIRKQAAEWALAGNPANAREFVARFQFYDAEVGNQAAAIAGPNPSKSAKRAATQQALDALGRDSSSVETAWQTNMAAQTGPYAAGPTSIGQKTNAELPDHISSIADQLGFGTQADGAYHAHKHAKELRPVPPPETEMVAYLDAARDLIRTGNGVVRVNQNGSRSVVFEGNGMRAIVSISPDGKASIATFGQAS
jgi:hypothetical protein